MDIDLNLGDENDWQKATAVVLLWAVLITANWWLTV